MARCERCGGPLLGIHKVENGWALGCLGGCAPKPWAGPEDASSTLEAAQMAAAGLGWYTLEDAGDEAMDRAEDDFRRAARRLPEDPALMWAELSARFGLRWTRTGDGDAALLLRRLELTGRRLEEDAVFRRLTELAAGTADLNWYREAAREADRLLDKARALSAGEDCDLFIALKTEDDGEPTLEKRFCDAVWDQLTDVYGVKRVFYAPKVLSGCRKEDFDPIVHFALRTARLLLVVAGTAAHADAPWVRSEWQRYLSREDGRALVCCLNGLEGEALPPALRSLPRVAAGNGDAGSVAGQVYRILTEAADRPSADPVALYERGRALLKTRPEKAARLLLEAATEQHAEAQLMLGRCYELGRGVPESRAEARRWYLAAAGRGVLRARAALDGLALREDAEKGIPAARTVIGAMYLKDVDGFGADPEAAARWLAPAAERGDPQACALFGCMLSEGHGVPEDRRQGRRLLNQARSVGNPVALAYLKEGRVPW